MDLWGLDGSQVEDWMLDARDIGAQAALLQSVATAGRGSAAGAAGDGGAGASRDVNRAAGEVAGSGPAAAAGAGNDGVSARRDFNGTGRDAAGAFEGRVGSDEEWAGGSREKKRQRQGQELTPAQMAAAAAEARRHQHEQQSADGAGLALSLSAQPIGTDQGIVSCKPLRPAVAARPGGGTADNQGAGGADALIINLMDSQVVDMLPPPPAGAAGAAGAAAADDDDARSRQKRRRTQQQQPQQQQYWEQHQGLEGQQGARSVPLIELLESQDVDGGLGMEGFAVVGGSAGDGGRTGGRAAASAAAGGGYGESGGGMVHLKQTATGRPPAGQAPQSLLGGGRRGSGGVLGMGARDQVGLGGRDVGIRTPTTAAATGGEERGRGMGVRRPIAAAAGGGGGGGEVSRGVQPLELKLVMDNKERLRDVDPNLIYGSHRREHQDKLLGKLPAGLVVRGVGDEQGLAGR
jgi:hypothetical protein